MGYFCRIYISITIGMMIWLTLGKAGQLMVMPELIRKILQPFLSYGGVEKFRLM